MRKVLVVDPSSPERNSIRQMLKDDYVVLTSGDWKEGTRIAAQERVDFALIGTDLPLSSDLPHFRALEKIRPPVSVILLVDEKAWGDRVHFLSMEWLPKPVRPESLREKLKALTPVRDWYDKGMDSFPPPAGAPQAWDREIFVEAVISILAHEIKNPLVTINTFSSLLPEKYSDPEFRNDFSRLAALEVNRINTVLERLFECSDLFYPAAAPMDLNSAVREFLEKEATNLSRREVRVATHLDARLPAVNFDGEHLDFVLRRIMEHMLATPSNGKCLRVATSLGAESGGNGRVAEVRIGFEPPAESGGESAAPARKTGTRFEKWSLSLLLAWRVMARNRSVLEAEWAGEEKNVRLLFTCE